MKKIFLLALPFLMASCSQQTFTLRAVSADASADQMAKPQNTENQPFFVNGIFHQTNTVDAAQVCGGADKVARVEVQQTAYDDLLAIITFWIYTPLETRVYCVGGKAGASPSQS